MAEGWIKLSRQLQDHWLWKEEPFDRARAWIDLLMLANYEDKKTTYKGKIITCKRGDVNLSFNALASRWGWSRHKVTNFIELLEADGMVATKRTTSRTVITLVNYDIYQYLGTGTGTTNGTSEGQAGDITNKEKKDKNIRSFKPNKFNQFEQADYDFDEIERMLNEN